MGCGCGKNKSARTISSPSSAPRISDAEMYDVFNTDGVVVASSSNIILARSEARRVGGTVVPREQASATAGVSNTEKEG